MKYAFDSFIVDTSTHELHSSGSSVAIEPKVFDVLVYLLENNDRVVSKDELVEAIWEGRFISDAAISSAMSALRKALNDDGKDQKLIKTARGRGFRFISPITRAKDNAPNDGKNIPDQDIRFCRSRDGTGLAYSIAGNGPPLVKTSHWLTHLEYDWQSPVWMHVNNHLLQGHTLVRFDQRGVGLSDWKVSDYSFERHVEDLEAVAEAAAIERFPLIGISQAAAPSVAFAARHPEKVSKLILLGGYVRGWEYTSRKDLAAASIPMIEHGWGGYNLSVQGFFSSNFMPDAPHENQKWFSELQQQSSTGANAAALLRALGGVNIEQELEKVKAPTLVMHARHDVVVPYDDGRALAAGIPDARFVTLETKNHIMPETDPAWSHCARLISDFLATD